MIIAIIVTTLISVTTIATSQLILSESQINLRYLDGIIASYAAESGVEWGLSAVRNNREFSQGNGKNDQAIKEGELEINMNLLNNMRNAQYKTFVWNSNQNNSEIDIGSGETQNLGFKGAGNSNWQLSQVEKMSGPDSCPASDNLFVYLLIKDSSSKTVILNRISNITGVWTEKKSDFDYYVSGIKNSLEIRPLILTRFLPTSTNLENESLKFPPADCNYKTKWNVRMPGSEITSSGVYIKGVGLYGFVAKENIITR